MAGEGQGPRNIAGPIVRGRDLVDRGPEIDLAWRLLDVGSILITAPRRHGKTSLMYALRDEPRQGRQVVIVDLMYVSSAAELLALLTSEVLSLQPVRSALRSLGRMPARLTSWIGGHLSEVELSLADKGDIKIALREKLSDGDWQDLGENQLSALDGMDGLVLALDEFPVMISTMLDAQPAEAVDLLRWLQSQRRRLHGVRFVLGGSVNIEPRLERIGQEALLNDLSRLPLRPMRPDRARGLVREVLRGEGLTAQEALVETILTTVGSGVPFFLQVMLQEVITAHRVHGEPLDTIDVARLYEEGVIGPAGRQRFSHYHSRLREYGPWELPAKAVLRALARREALTENQLDQELRAAGFDEELDEVLVRLEADYYIERREGLTRFADKIVRDWWRVNAPEVRRGGRAL